MAAVTEATPNPNEQVDLSTIPTSPEGADDTDSKKGEDGEITVFHDPEHFNVIHPLMNRWTLWYTVPPTGKDINWNDLLKKFHESISSVEEFWGVYNNINTVSKLAIKSDYHLFKDGIRPEWEDSHNKHGGKWSYQFKEKRNINIDELWLQVMLAAIGETLEDENDGEVQGVVVNVRKAFYRIGVWTRTVGKSIPNGGDGDCAGGKGRTPEKAQKILLDIGKRFKKILDLKPSEVVEFSGHTESAQSGSTRARPKFIT